MAACAIAPAIAQDGALWRDDKGRQMEVGFAGGGTPAPLPAAWSADSMADLFYKVCVATAGEPAAVKAVSIALKMTDKSYDMPVGKKEPWPLVIARGDGVVVSQADHFLSNKQPQCNVTFYTSESVDKAEVESTLSSTFGRPADNAADRMKKNGKPNRYYAPEWSDDTDATITVSPIASSGQTGYQFSLLANTKERK